MNYWPLVSAAIAGLVQFCIGLAIVRRDAIAAATGTAKTAQRAECEASQSGPKGIAQKDAA